MMKNEYNINYYKLGFRHGLNNIDYDLRYLYNRDYSAGYDAGQTKRANDLKRKAIKGDDNE